MLSVFGVAPSELISQGPALVQLPAFLGRTVGGALPVDCQVGVLELPQTALTSCTHWAWKPADRGYVVSAADCPFSVLKNHLRQMRQLQDELGSNRIWPWFDPRYLKIALSTLDGTDLEKLFGPIQMFSFACEPKSLKQTIECYQLQAGRLQIKQVPA